ncbi:MAG: transketolase C-terminal domain-containing protein, partial [bacterium]
CYYAALTHKHGPSTLIFSRQNLPSLTRPASFSPDDVLKGGYILKEGILKESPQPKLVLVATGSEVGAAVEAATMLEAEGGHSVQVVSMPCVELFTAQSAAYKAELFPAGARIAVVEAGVTLGWSSILGRDALAIGIDHYGASAPGEILAEKFGFTGQAIKERIAAWIES